VSTVFDVAAPRDLDGIRTRPDILSAARALMHSLAACGDVELRVAVLKRVARCLGDANYPVFIKLLTVVGDSDDRMAKRLLADTLAFAMMRGDVPSGSLTGWGSAGSWAASASGALPASSFLRVVPRRQFDPIEYLTAWFSQSTDRVRLRREIYECALTALVKLFDVHPAGARSYQSKLKADAANQPEGTFAEATRMRLFEIASDWERGAEPGAIAARA